MIFGNVFVEQSFALGRRFLVLRFAVICRPLPQQELFLFQSLDDSGERGRANTVILREVVESPGIVLANMLKDIQVTPGQAGFVPAAVLLST